MKSTAVPFSGWWLCKKNNWKGKANHGLNYDNETQFLSKLTFCLIVLFPPGIIEPFAGIAGQV